VQPKVTTTGSMYFCYVSIQTTCNKSQISDIGLVSARLLITLILPRNLIWSYRIIPGVVVIKELLEPHKIDSEEDDEIQLPLLTVIYQLLLSRSYC
jgi:hypothetical protein